MADDLWKNHSVLPSATPAETAPERSATAPYVLDIIRFALNDGPGVRTTVFLKGCPLRCRFCHNPESQRLVPETGCEGTVYGRQMPIHDIVSTVLKDRAYYEESGGGVTISGGEPLIFPDYVQELLRRFKEAGIHTTIDTSGYVPYEAFEAILPFTDLFLFDYKETGSEAHRQLTGVPNERILANLRRVQSEKPVILRCVLIDGVNDRPEHLQAIADLYQTLPGIRQVDILPFHNTGNHKYTRLGREIPLPLDNTGEEAKQRWLAYLQPKIDRLTIDGHSAPNAPEQTPEG